MSDKTIDEAAKIHSAVMRFRRAMEEKLLEKMWQGYYGWDDPASNDVIRRKLADHAARLCAGDDKQAVDVANLAMMLHYQAATSKEDDDE